MAQDPDGGTPTAQIDLGKRRKTNLNSKAQAAPVEWLPEMTKRTKAR
jgi:hypothetical protein